MDKNKLDNFEPDYDLYKYKYIKYKSKYLKLLNKYNMTGGAQNGKYYIISAEDNTLNFSSLRKLLKKHKLIECKEIECRKKDIALILTLQLYSSKSYDKTLYDVKSDIRNILIENDSKYKIINKKNLYLNMKKEYENIATIHMAQTTNIMEAEKLSYPIILRPTGKYFCSGRDVFVVSNKKELEEKIKFYNENKAGNVIASSYIKNPLLFNGKKMHCRMYLLITQLINGQKNWSFCPVGEILTAKKPYKNSDYGNKEIHDTHAASTDDLFLWSEDKKYNELIQTNMITESELKQMMTQLRYIAMHIAKLYDKPIGYPESVYSFEVFGLDIMFDASYKPPKVMLIECNDRVGYETSNKIPKKHKYLSETYLNWIYKNAIYPFINLTNYNENNWSNLIKQLNEQENKIIQSYNQIEFIKL